MSASSPRREPEAIGDRRRQRAYTRDLLPALVVYVVVLVVARSLGTDGAVAKALTVAVPIVPFAWAVRAMVRRLGRSDDYQRALVLTSLAVGFAAALGASLVVAFLAVAEVAVDPVVAGWIPFLAGIAGWGLASVVVGRR